MTPKSRMSTPQLQLETLFVLDENRRIRSTREPGGGPGPMFSLVRGTSDCAWAVRVDVPDEVARELHRLALTEPPVTDFRRPPVHAERYLALLSFGVPNSSALHRSDGPAFRFPNALAPASGVIAIEDEHLLDHHFKGWVPGEIAEGRSPVVAIAVDGHPVSVCFCARRSDAAAEAGVETAEAYRGRGYGSRVTVAWALAVRASGRVPLYSTSWSNAASLAVAHRLGLTIYASDWSVSG